MSASGLASTLLYSIRSLTIVLLACIGADAQMGTIAGSVTDVSGGGVPRALVTAKNIKTGATRTGDTGGSGAYSIPDLSVGQYEVTVTKAGFSTAKYAEVPLTVAQVLTLNVSLQVGTTSQTVDVTSTAAPTIELETSQLSNVVDERRITELPLLTRNPYDLVLLSPGASQTNGVGGFSVNGSRDRNNNFLLDGVDNNDTSVPGGPGGLASLNPDATQEFRVITSNFLPEYGRNTGAVIDIVTKSGTNEFHGSAYEFGRYRALAARDYFNTKPNPQDPFVRNDFGFSVGGPIRKNRTFFFFNDEYQRFRTTLTNSEIVPTAAFKSGVFNYGGAAINLANPASPNNPLGLPLDPTVQKLLALLPNPNGESVDDVRGIYRFASPDALNDANVTFKLDEKITDKHSLSLRYAYTGFSENNNGHNDYAPGLLGSVQAAQQVHGIAANLISSFRPDLVNQFQFGVNRNDNPFTCNGRSAVDQIGGVDPFGAGSDFSFAGSVPTLGCGNLGDSNAQTRRTGTYSVGDNLSVTRGSHSLKFGGDFRYVFENGYDAFFSRQSLAFNTFSNSSVPAVTLDPAHPCDPNTLAFCGSTVLQDLSSALLGVVATQSQSQFFDKNGTRTALDFRKFRQHEYSAYAQDVWKVFPNFTLNYGLRYQFNGVPFEVNNNLSNLFQDPQGFAPFTFPLVGPGTHRLLYDNDPLNFEPRFGFSWDPFKTGKTAVRGGYGIFHDRIFGNLFGNARGNPPFQQDVFNTPNAPLSAVTPIATVPTSSTVTDGSFLGPVLFDPHLKIPVSQNWNFDVQHELAGGLTIDLAYVGSKGNHILRVINGNQALPSAVNALLASGAATPSQLQFTGLYTNFTTTDNTALLQPNVTKSIGNSTYHSFQANIRKRFSDNFDMQGVYTWAHSIDDSSDALQPATSNRSFPRNSFNLREERGDSDFDVRQRGVINYVLQLPFGPGKRYLNHGVASRVLGGWALNGITTFQSGHPLDIFGNRDAEHTGVSSRADVVGSTSIPSGSDRTQTGPPLSAFALRPYGRPGSYGRNSLVGPGVNNTDAALVKDTTIRERFSLQLRFEAFNVFNQVQFAQPDNLIADVSTFGFSTATVVRPDGTTSNRQLQLALKLKF